MRMVDLGNAKVMRARSLRTIFRWDFFNKVIRSVFELSGV